MSVGICLYKLLAGSMLRLLPIVLALLLLHCSPAASKIFDRCELAQLMVQRHGLPISQVATLVCIAQHSSDLNTATFGGGIGPGGGSHGLFQISDVYWCSPPGQGAGCGLNCARLRDDDITDDLQCVRKIHAEHQRISGDGFTAWQAYQAYCQPHAAPAYIAGCAGLPAAAPAPARGLAQHIAASYQPQPQPPPRPYYQAVSTPGFGVAPAGKIYNRCELAQELYYQHKMPMQQIPTWVCIAQHESSFNTAAVGRLNADGSADHGLFQISDLFWCTHDQRGGKGCQASCNQFLDSNIADDVQCIKRIHQEHTHISGDGFTAWTVYNRDCRNQRYDHIAACFNKPAIAPHPNAIIGTVQPYKLPQKPVIKYQYNPAPSFNIHAAVSQGLSRYQNNPFLRQFATPQVQSQAVHAHPNAIGYVRPQKTPLYNVASTPANPFYKYRTQQQTPQFYQQSLARSGKVYKRCELAKELFFIHKFPMQDVATWVCIALHESRYDTSAVGRLNADGSADHGLFQISDLYWCTHDAQGGKGCQLPCEQLLNEDITDDVQCIRIIHEEHTRISGDGYTAWTVYNGHCRGLTKSDIADCFDNNEIDGHEPEEHQQQLVKVQHTVNNALPVTKASSTPAAALNNRYASNPFLRHLLPKAQQAPTAKPPSKTIVSTLAPVVQHADLASYANNPFLRPYIGGTAAQGNVLQVSHSAAKPSSQTFNSIDNKEPSKHILSYAHNPFLSKYIPTVDQLKSHPQTTTIAPFISKQPTQSITLHPYVDSKSFRHETTTQGTQSTTAGSAWKAPTKSVSSWYGPAEVTTLQSITMTTTSKPETTTQPAKATTVGSAWRTPIKSVSNWHSQTKPIGFVTSKASWQTTTPHPTASITTRSTATSRQSTSFTYALQRSTTPTPKPIIVRSQTTTVRPFTHNPHTNSWQPTTFKWPSTTTRSPATTRTTAKRPATTSYAAKRPETTKQTTLRTTFRPTFKVTATTTTIRVPSTIKLSTTTPRPWTKTKTSTTASKSTRAPTTAFPFHAIWPPTTTRRSTTTVTRLPSPQRSFNNQSSVLSTLRPSSHKSAANSTQRPLTKTITTRGSSTASPFDHPFFDKYRAKFSETFHQRLSLSPAKPTALASASKTPSPASSSQSPYYAKFQQNSAKVAAKTIYAYGFGVNHTTTAGSTTKKSINNISETNSTATGKPRSVFDVYLNWNQK